MARLEAQARDVLFADLRALAGSGRPDRAAEAALGMVRSLGRIAEADPAGLRSLFRTIAETAGATAATAVEGSGLKVQGATARNGRKGGRR